MGLRLLSAALLFVGSALPYAAHYSLSERTGRGPWQEQVAAPGWPEAPRARRRAPQAREEGAADEEGSICSFLSLDGALCVFPASVVFGFGSLPFCRSTCL